MIQVQEGEFDLGHLNGYGRIMKSDQTASVGYFEGGQKSGKAIEYNRGVLVNQGIYSHSKKTGETTITRHETILDFLSNNN